MYTLHTTTKDAWNAMYTACQQARSSILLEMFICTDDTAGKQFITLWKQKAAEGVTVQLILDAFGSKNLTNQTLKELQAAGVSVLFFNGLRAGYRNIWKRLVARTHRKLLVVDESVGFIGGVNIQEDMREWPDFMLEIRDRDRVAPLHQTILRDASHSSGESLLSAADRPTNTTMRGDTVSYFFDKGEEDHSAARRQYIDMLHDAQHSATYITPYFFPDDAFIEALTSHANRISIALILPIETDMPIASHASQAYVQRLIAAGVHVYLYPRMLHAKGVLIDDTSFFFGSSNLDLTSFYDNFESDVLTTEPDIIAIAKHALSTWKAQSNLLDITTWKQRGWTRKVNEYAALALFQLWHFTNNIKAAYRARRA